MYNYSCDLVGLEGCGQEEIDFGQVMDVLLSRKEKAICWVAGILIIIIEQAWLIRSKRWRLSLNKLIDMTMCN